MKSQRPLSMYPKPFVEALSCFHVLRALGFSSDDIYFTPQGYDMSRMQREFAVVLRAQGKELCITVGPMSGSTERVAQDWKSFTGLVRDGYFPPGAMQRAYEKSHTRRNQAALVMCLAQKGFQFKREGLADDAPS